MSQRLHANTAYLKYLATLQPVEAKKLIAFSCKDNIDCLCDIVYNVLKGHIKITPQEEQIFRKRKALVYKLINKRLPWTTKRRQLQQSGGFPPLLALLAPIIGGALGAVTKNLVSKAMNK